MLFNSWEFVLFFGTVTVLYSVLPYNRRTHLLLLASYLFYMAWRYEFALLMLFTTVINFYAGKRISLSHSKTEKKKWLVLAVLFSLAPLLYFKYVDFFIVNYNGIMKLMGMEGKYCLLNLILPVGISFFTFQSLSYSFDIYTGRTKIEKNFVKFATFVAFFPQLIAGPIERSSNLLCQFRERHRFKFQNFMDGTKLFIWGLFKKVVIADRLSLYVDRIYEAPELYSGTTLALATIFFAFQIYCDFSGYSDMAIGTAKILGFRLMQNFNLPYFSSSIADFWKRWHISLSSWFRDYLYLPLGGSRVAYQRWVLNIFVVFLVSGFWHGANWTFIIWGGLHALFYLLENFGDRLLAFFSWNALKKRKAYKLFKITSVFILVCFAWIYFRAHSITDAFLISRKIIFDWGSTLYRGFSNTTFVLSLFLMLFLIIVQVLQHYRIMSLYFSKPKTHSVAQFLWFICLMLGISLFGTGSDAFIYFQF